MNHLPKLPNRLTGYIPVLAALLLQSCCLGPLGLGSLGKNNPSTKPCNCHDKRNVDVVSDYRSDAAITTITGHAPGLAENDPATLADQAAGENSGYPALPVSGYSAVETPASSQLQEPAEVVPAMRSDALGQDKEVRLPFGIKGVRSWIVAGPNLSFKKHDGEDGSNYKRKAGVSFHFGFGSTYYFTDKVAFSPSLHFKQMKAGGKTTVAGESAFTENYTYNYLSAPLLAQFNVATGLSAFAGPEINYLVSGRSTTSYAGETHKESLTKGSVKLGVGMQAGIRYTIPDTRFSMQLVYDHRISRVNKKEGGYDYGGGYAVPATRLSGFQLGIICSVCNQQAAKK